ncbi:MAG: hypothetical protein R3B36_23690 [Polyangiaceae bacterium]
MDLKCFFHVPSVRDQRPEPARQRMPSLLDVDVTWEEEPRARGVSIETWHRARGWSSED